MRHTSRGIKGPCWGFVYLYVCPGLCLVPVDVPYPVVAASRLTLL
jgi:hypothetical protein